MPLTGQYLWAEPIADEKTIAVELQLETGGRLTGPVLDIADDGLVIVFNKRPFALAWDEIEVGSAYRAKRNWLNFVRGGANQLSAQDHFDLGSFTLSRGRLSTASREFELATSLDPAISVRIKQTFAQHRQASQTITQRRNQLLPASELAPGPGRGTGRGAGSRSESESGSSDRAKIKTLTLAKEIDGVFSNASSSYISFNTNVSPVVREKVMSAYRQFGQAVEQTMGRHVGLIETEHFLIWTDWEKSSRPRIASLAERMYETLCHQFGLDPKKNIFLAKCPMFCWRSAAQLRKFARRFDGYDGTNTAGYTRTVQQTGHVHIVLVRFGTSELAQRRFAETLVHEGTHAFLHRLYSTRLLPHWVNEGVAELMTQRVIGASCVNDTKARLLTKQYVKHRLPIANFLANIGPIDVSEYPLAHSVVAYLEQQSFEHFVSFIKRLKAGQTLSLAMAESFDGMTLIELETQWRKSVRSTNPLKQDDSHTDQPDKQSTK